MRPPSRSSARIAALAAMAVTMSLATMVASARPARGQTGGEVITAYDVDITIERAGSILVMERIDYDFGPAERHGIFRDIPIRFHYDDRYDRVYPLDVLSVQGSPGTPAGYDVQHQDNLLRIKIGDADRTITGRHVYTITYRVQGSLNGFADHDELYWNAIGTSWSAPILRASIRVRAPADVTRVACFAGPERSSLPCQEAATSGDSASFDHTGLGPYEGLTVVVGFPAGAVASTDPVLRERWSFGRAFAVNRVTLSLAGLLLVLLLLGVLRLLWVVGRDRRAVGSPVDVAYGTSDGGEQPVPLFEHGVYPVEYAPPDDVRPGQVGTLVDEVAGPLDVTATIVDLAVRRYLRIEEIPKRWFLGKPDWRLVQLKPADQDLLRYEELLLNGLFEDPDDSGDDVSAEADDGGEDAVPDRPDQPGAAQPPSDSPSDGLARVRLSALRRKFSARLVKVEEALYQDAMKRRWFAGRPDKVRASWAARGWVVFLAGDGLVWLAAARSHLGIVPIPVVLAGLALIWGARWMPRRTARGTGLARRVLGFRTYIETAEAHESRFQERENIFSRYLPYAIVFGVTEKWARAFRGLDGQPPTTAWYVGSRPFTVGSFTSSIDHFSVATTGTISSTPAASGSSGFSGGSSGGGGGGGGGGSW